MFALDAEAEESLMFYFEGFEEIELLFVTKSSFGNSSEGALEAIKLGQDTGSRPGFGPIIFDRFAIPPHAIELEPSTGVLSITGPRNLQPLHVAPDVSSTVVFMFELLIVVNGGSHVQFIV